MKLLIMFISINETAKFKIEAKKQPDKNQYAPKSFQENNLQ